MLKRNQVRFGSTGFKCSSRTIWNTLPHHLNCQNFLQNFKKAMKCWNGENCECSDCQSVFWSTSPPSQHLLVWSWQWWHWCWVLTLSWWVGPYRIETSPLICYDMDLHYERVKSFRGWDWRYQNVKNDDFLVSLLLAWSILRSFLWSVCCWLWTCNCLEGFHLFWSYFRK